MRRGKNVGNTFLELESIFICFHSQVKGQMFVKSLEGLQIYIAYQKKLFRKLGNDWKKRILERIDKRL